MGDAQSSDCVIHLVSKPMPFRTLIDSELNSVYLQTESAVGPSSCQALNDGYSYTAVSHRRLEKCYKHITPRFHAQKRSGALLPFTPYQRYSGKSQIDSVGTATLRYQVGSGSSLCTIDTAKQFAVDCPVPLDIHGMMAAFNGKWPDLRSLVIDAYAECIADLDVGTQVAEMHKTVDMTVDVGERLFRTVQKAVASYSRGGVKALYRDAVHRNYGKARGSFADEWLATQYGYAQLDRDIKSMLDAWAKRFLNISRGKVDGPTSFTQSASRETVLYWGGGPAATVHIDTTREFRLESVARAAVKYYHALPNAYVDGYVTLYEMIPYSWVVDWFVNIGNTLKAWNVLRNAHSHSAALGYQLTCDTKVATVPGNPAVLPWSNASCSGFTASATEKLLLRIPAGAPPLIPRINHNLSIAKLITLTSLLEQQRNDISKTNFTRR